MMGENNFTTVEISSGILYINIYPIADYPRKIGVSKTVYDKSYYPDKWRKRIGNTVYYYGKGVNDRFEEIEVDNPLFGMIFRKYILDLLSENVAGSWHLKELKSILRIIKEISERYAYYDKIKLQYELIVDVHHWENTNFGLIVDLKINVFDRETNGRISYQEIGYKYGENVRKSVWKSVQAFHRHLTQDGRKYATAMRDKFNLLTALLKDAFGSSDEDKSFETPDGVIKLIFRPLEVVEVNRR